MRPVDLVVRCYAEQKGDVWQAFCIDLNLAAQGDNFEDVKSRLDRMIGSYVYDAMAGEDSEYADQLLSRKAPLYFRFKYHLYSAFHHVRMARNGVHRLFTTVMPMHPAHV